MTQMATDECPAPRRDSRTCAPGRRAVQKHLHSSSASSADEPWVLCSVMAWAPGDVGPAVVFMVVSHQELTPPVSIPANLARLSLEIPVQVHNYEGGKIATASLEVAMTWFDQLKQALPAYYRPDRPAEIVGYLRGSGEPSVWRQMEAIQHRHQMLILGNVEPTNEEWGHAGVAQRGGTQVVTIDKLTGLIVLYGGFMLNRPWGEIHSQTPDAITIGFPAALKSWQRNYRPPKY